MTRTRFEIDASIAADVAKGYVTNRDGSLDGDTPANEARDGRGYKVPNGAIFTTVDDLSRFVAFELGHGPASVLPPARLDTAFGGFVASGADLGSGYGLGFMAMRRGTFTYLGHNGAVAGYGAAMYFDRAAQVGVVLFRTMLTAERRTRIAWPWTFFRGWSKHGRRGCGRVRQAIQGSNASSGK